MRRIVGLILAGVGAFFVVLALFLRFYVPGQVLKFPTTEYQIAVLKANNASYFSAAQLRLLSGIPVTATTTLRGDVMASNDSTAVWDQFTVVKDDTNNVNFNYTQLRGPFDRRTGVLANCCGSAWNNTAVHLSGQGFVWPLGVQQKTYTVFDATPGKPEPATYAGKATVNGLPTYRFVEQVAPTQFSTQTLPGTLVGMPDQPSVQLPEYYQATNTYWVDPVTGGPVDVEQNQELTLRDSSGTVRLVVFRADLKFTPASVQSFVNNDVNGKNKINLISSVLPLVLLVVGLALLAVGIVLALLGRREEGEPATQGGYQPQDQGLAPH